MKLSNTALLLFMGLGAVAIYQYNKMDDAEKDELKDQGRKIFDEHIAPFLKSAMGTTLGFSESVNKMAHSASSN